MVRIAVIGAGIVGLCSAVNIQKLIPSAKITIIADKFDLDTTSSGAGGLYRPSTQKIKGVSAETIKEWIKDTWDFYVSLAMSSLAKETGQSLVPGYVISDDPDIVHKPVYEDLVFHFRHLTPEELKKMNFPTKYGITFKTVITQPQKFMPWLMKQFKEHGGTVKVRTVDKLEELSGEYDIVVNCCGLRAQQLLSDTAMYPIKGQLIHVKAPWIKMFIYHDCEHPTYFLPHDDYIIVGGTREVGNYSLDIVPEVQQNIMERAEKLLPEIKGGEIVGSWAGLRPARTPLRLEKQLINVNGKKLRVVHNYGHGANGVSLGWGTSVQAAKLVQEWANELPLSSKL